VKGITANSRHVKEGFTFVAIKGTKKDGHDFIHEAINRGASCIVAEKDFELKGAKVEKSIVENSKVAFGELVSEFYGHPSKKLKVIGITGTNGKTTTSYLIESILKQAGFNTGVIGTIHYRFKNVKIAANNTTPDALRLHVLLNEMLEEGANFVLMEVSSHAIDQDRIAGIDFDTAIFTNISPEHLDYHKTMENYKETKASFFRELSDSSFAILNADDELGCSIDSELTYSKLRYSINADSELRLRKADMTKEGMMLDIETPKGLLRMETTLLGEHNIYNILAAVACCIRYNIHPQAIIDGVKAMKLIPGRLQRIDRGQPFLVFVDYAHTEDGLRNVLTTVKKMCKGKILTVFGCGGDRDKTKRPKMGKVASDNSDKVFITCDNPRSEMPEKIAKDILAGISKERLKAASVIHDRGQAIERAIMSAGIGDCVLIAGKGHERYQVFMDREVEFDDCQTANSVIMNHVPPTRWDKRPTA